MLDTQNSPAAKDKSSCNQKKKHVRVCAVRRRCTLILVFVPFLRLCFSRRRLQFTRESKFFSPRSASQRRKMSACAERQVQSGKQRAGKRCGIQGLSSHILSTQNQTDLYTVEIACCCSGKDAEREINGQVEHVLFSFFVLF